MIPIAALVLAAAVRAQAPMRVGGEVKPPVAIARVDPDYEACKGQRLWGFPIIEAIIDEHGAVTKARLLKPVHPCLARVTLAAIRQWKFRPATYRGKAVPVIYNVTVHIHWR